MTTYEVRRWRGAWHVFARTKYPGMSRIRVASGPHPSKGDAQREVPTR